MKQNDFEQHEGTSNIVKSQQTNQLGELRLQNEIVRNA